MTSSLCLTLIALLTVAVSAAPVAPTPDEIVRERSKFLPQRSYQPLPGKALGVFVGNVTPVMQLEGRGGPPDALAFSRAGMSYRWVYVPVQGNARITDLTVPVGEKGEKKVVYPALDIITTPLAKHLGVNKFYTLVEVEVNDGAGSPADESFVATKVRVVEGTREYPLNVSEALDRVREKYQSYQKEQQKAITLGLESARKTALGDRTATGPRETAEVLYVTWLPETERLRVVFRTTITDGAYQTGPAPAGNRPGPATAPGVVPPKVTVRWGTAFGVEYGRAYEVSKTGELIKTFTLPIELFKKEIPPAPVAPQLTPPPGAPARKPAGE